MFLSTTATKKKQVRHIDQELAKAKMPQVNYDKLKLYLILSAGILLMVVSVANRNYGVVCNGFYNSNLKFISGIGPIVVKEKFNPALRSESLKIFERSNIKLIDYLTFKELIPIDPVKLQNIKEIVNLDSEILTDFIQTVRNKLGK